MNYFDFKDKMGEYVSNINSKDAEKLWNVYLVYYDTFGEAINMFLDSLFFLYNKDKSLLQDELIILLSILISIKKEIYMKMDQGKNYKVIFPSNMLEYETKHNSNICNDYLKELKNTFITEDEKIDFTYNYYFNTMNHEGSELTHEDLINIVQLNYYLPQCFENFVQIDTITYTINNCYTNLKNSSYVARSHWCIGNILAFNQNSYNDFVSFLKQIIDNEVIDKKDFDTYLIMGMISNVDCNDKIYKVNNKVDLGQKYFIGTDDNLFDISQSINDYIHDDTYEEKETDFMLGIIKKGLLVSNDKKIILN